MSDRPCGLGGRASVANAGDWQLVIRRPQESKGFGDQ
jgi:hypothetical protein